MGNYDDACLYAWGFCPKSGGTGGHYCVKNKDHEANGDLSHQCLCRALG